MKSKTLDPIQKNTREIQPYPPSFLDRFMNFIQRLPLSYWLIYLLLFILESSLNHVLAWVDGWLPAFKFNALMGVFPLWQWGTFAAITYLNETSESTLSKFRTLLDLDDNALEKLKYEFTSMKNRGVILSSILWVIVYFLITYYSYEAAYIGYGVGNFFRVYIFLGGLIAFSTGSVIYYHSIRQLWLINRTVKEVKRFNLFHLQPVYAFSHLTARTGISWMFLLGLTILMFPLDLAKWLTLAMMGFQIILALAAFVLPLRSVNHRLSAEKLRLMAENHHRTESVLERLHQNLDKNEMSEVEALNEAIAGLNAERDILKKISTLPWSMDTLTGFLSAVVLPIALLLIQIAIQKWLVG